MPLVGTVLHLWFLPFSFLFLALTRRLNVFSLWAICLFALVLFLAVEGGRLPIPLAQWDFVFPAAVCGLVAGRLPAWKIPVLSAGLLFTVLALSVGVGGGALQLWVALSAMLLTFLVSVPGTPLTDFLAKASFGIYLAHPLFIALGLQMDLSPVALLIFAIAGSHVLTWGLQRWMPQAV